MVTNYLEIRKLAKLLADAGISFFFQELTNGYAIMCFGMAIREIGDVNLFLPSYGEGADRLSVERLAEPPRRQTEVLFEGRLVPSTTVFLLLQSLHDNTDTFKNFLRTWNFSGRVGEAYQDEAQMYTDQKRKRSLK